MNERAGGGHPIGGLGSEHADRKCMDRRILLGGTSRRGRCVSYVPKHRRQVRRRRPLARCAATAVVILSLADGAVRLAQDLTSHPAIVIIRQVPAVGFLRSQKLPSKQDCWAALRVSALTPGAAARITSGRSGDRGRGRRWKTPRIAGASPHFMIRYTGPIPDRDRTSHHPSPEPLTLRPERS